MKKKNDLGHHWRRRCGWWRRGGEGDGRLLEAGKRGGWQVSGNPWDLFGLALALVLLYSVCSLGSLFTHYLSIMPFTYIIGTIESVLHLHNTHKKLLEHMEEDEQSQKTLPDWVELEYLARSPQIRQ